MQVSSKLCEFISLKANAMNRLFMHLLNIWENSRGLWRLVRLSLSILFRMKWLKFSISFNKYFEWTIYNRLKIYVTCFLEVAFPTTRNIQITEKQSWQLEQRQQTNRVLMNVLPHYQTSFNCNLLTKCLNLCIFWKPLKGRSQQLAASCNNIAFLFTFWCSL